MIRLSPLMLHALKSLSFFFAIWKYCQLILSMIFQAFCHICFYSCQLLLELCKKLEMILQSILTLVLFVLDQIPQEFQIWFSLVRIRCSWSSPSITSNSSWWYSTSHPSSTHIVWPQFKLLGQRRNFIVLIADLCLHMNNLFGHLSLLSLHLFSESSNVFHHRSLLRQAFSPHMTVTTFNIFDFPLKSSGDFFLKLGHTTV
jgi:hypothetical protein